MNTGDELIARLLDGSIEDADVLAVREEMARDPEFAAEIADLTRIDRLLRFKAYLDNEKPDLVLGVLRRLEFSNQKSDTFQASVNREIERRATGRFGKSIRFVVTSLAAAASVAIVAGLWWLKPAAALGLRVAEIQSSEVRVQRSEGKSVPAVQGMELREGDRVVVQEGGKVGLKYDGEETRIELMASTEAGFGAEKGAKRVNLAVGTLVCTAAPQKMPFEIATRHAVSRIVGTRFRLAVANAKSSLAVQVGKVDLCQGEKILEISAGQEATATDGGMKMEPIEPTQAQGLLLDLDFEDRILPEGSSGLVVEGPHAVNSRFCVAGVLDRDNRLFRVDIWNGSQTLLTYREGAVLSFDYWVKKQTDAIDVYFWNATRSVSPGYTVYGPVQEQWMRVAIRLKDTKDGKDSIPQDGDLILNLVIQTTPGGNELFVDNVRIETEDEP